MLWKYPIQYPIQYPIKNQWLLLNFLPRKITSKQT